MRYILQWGLCVMRWLIKDLLIKTNGMEIKKQMSRIRWRYGRISDGIF